MKKSLNKTRRIVYLSLLIALAIAMHTFEASLALPLPYGIKLGLANIISLVTIQFFTLPEVATLNFLRVVLAGLIGGKIFNYMWWISCGGVFLSTIAIMIGKKLFKLPVVSLSIVSAIMHGIGQVLVVSYFFDTFAFVPMLIIMFISGIPTGIFTGMCATTCINYLKKHL